jgi:hypothetical protein
MVLAGQRAPVHLQVHDSVNDWATRLSEMGSTRLRLSTIPTDGNRTQEGPPPPFGEAASEQRPHPDGTISPTIAS